MKSLLFAITLLTACGSDSSDNQPAPQTAQQAAAPTPHSLAVTAMADLPVCDEAHNQQLVYVLDAKEFHTCQAGAWVKIDMTPPVDLVAEAKAVHNALKSIALGQSWDSVPANAKAALLSDKATVKDDSTHCGAARKSHTIIGYGTEEYKFNYALYTSGGAVVGICEWAGATPTCTSVPCP